ncbi:hypothetical protein [Lentilactobacillus sp. SPB1-3]|uniref:Uncharacterized protein n=1 Tax=Lentilactobacillus terminaliae TaxID=3003483 RepID=A0ACD5DDH9_9LACO|nr:hypothetical protein [Lentilactobacillus sp. SPB1-3]MCZ0978103.1 hypothetical protein [Lentilactobacillus sp. SPB1-3]
MDKSEFELYHEDEVLAIPTNRINTTPGSPTERLMKVFDKAIYDDIKDTESIAMLNDLDNAVGGQLDDIGDDFDLLRLGKPDDLYRFLLKMKSVNRSSKVTFNSLINLIADTFNIDKHDVQLRNDYQLQNDDSTVGDPFHVSVQDLPLENIEHPEIVQLFIDEIQDALALGITLSKVTFQISLPAQMYVGTALTTMNFVELESDVDTETFEHVITETSYLRSTQTIQTTYEIESEEV